MPKLAWILSVVVVLAGCKERSVSSDSADDALTQHDMVSDAPSVTDTPISSDTTFGEDLNLPEVPGECLSEAEYSRCAEEWTGETCEEPAEESVRRS